MDEKRRERFSKLFDNDPLGLLKIEPVEQKEITGENARLIEQFQEIVQFYEDKGHIPSDDSGDIKEFMLSARLAGIKRDPEKVKILMKYDLYNLLDRGVTKSFSIDEILSDDPLGLLDLSDEDTSIFSLSHVSASKRIRPDYIAHRKVCKNFEVYEPGFESIRDDLETGRKKACKI